MTYFVALPFILDSRGRARPGEALPAASATQARKMAAILADRLGKKGGAVAFSRTGNPDSGDWEDAVILATHGEVPLQVFDADTSRERSASGG